LLDTVKKSFLQDCDFCRNLRFFYMFIFIYCSMFKSQLIEEYVILFQFEMMALESSPKLKQDIL
jgi:hypothetical protein